MCTLPICAALAVALGVADAATLQQLSLDDMIQKSTAIVRGRPRLAGGAANGLFIYTHYSVQVMEQLKGAPSMQIDVAVPGGTANGLRQAISGAPTLADGQEYVLFLWTSRNGITQIIGLSQGLFYSANGLLTRLAIAEHMIDSNGAAASASGMQISLSDLRARIAAAVGGRPLQ